jgi:hypothetical protein
VKKWKAMSDVRPRIGNLEAMVEERIVRLGTEENKI